MYVLAMLSGAREKVVFHQPLDLEPSGGGVEKWLGDLVLWMKETLKVTSYLPTYIHTYIHAYTYLHTYIHTYTYMLTYRAGWRRRWWKV